MRVEFEFCPGQKIKIIAYGLHYDGRILRNYVGRDGFIFHEVEYAAEGKIERNDFYPDDLQAI